MSDDKKPDMPVLPDLVIHFIGGMIAVAILLAGPMLSIGVPHGLVLLINIAGGLALSIWFALDKHK